MSPTLATCQSALHLVIIATINVCLSHLCFDAKSILSLYFSEGAFREVYLAKLPTETLIFKAYVWDSDFEMEDYEWMRFDALVAEKLTPWRDMIVSIYGFCGTAMINEAMTHGDVENKISPLSHYYTVEAAEQNSGNLIVKNELTGTQKLLYGLEMAEAIAVMHAYSGGVIVHNE